MIEWTLCCTMDGSSGTTDVRSVSIGYGISASTFVVCGVPCCSTTTEYLVTVVYRSSSNWKPPFTPMANFVGCNISSSCAPSAVVVSFFRATYSFTIRKKIATESLSCWIIAIDSMVPMKVFKLTTIPWSDV